MTSSFSVERVAGRSVVVHQLSRAPLRLLTPDNRGGAAWVFVSSLGGGFVGADSLQLDVDVRAGSVCWLSSQASSKAYRATHSFFGVDARVGEDACLLVWPDAVTCFAQASLRQVQRAQVAASGSLVWVDVLSAGRVARGERWAFDAFESRLSVDVGERPWLRDAVRLDSRHGSLDERLRGFDATATVTLLGPRLRAAAERIDELIRRRPLREPVLLTASRRDDGLVVRAGAPSLESLNEALRGLLRDDVTSVLGDDPFARKW